MLILPYQGGRDQRKQKAVHVPDPKERNLRVYAADGTIARGHTRVPLEVSG